MDADKTTTVFCLQVEHACFLEKQLHSSIRMMRFENEMNAEDPNPEP